MDNKIAIMHHILQKVVYILNENNIPYYLDCGTLLGFIREGDIMEKDTDVDVTTHISFWDKLNSIDFKKYDLIRTRTRNCKKKGYIISVKTKQSRLYLDIYANPAFPLLDNKEFNGINYCIPKNSELYLTQLYGNWKVPSKKHADWPKYFYNGLINSAYAKYWDLDYTIQLDPIPSPPDKTNLNKDFWHNYYNNTTDDINTHSTFALFVYNNFISIANCITILDLGAGNCRDSTFFAEKGIQVKAIDYNGTLDKEYDNLQLIKEDVECFLSKYTANSDIIYMRWFLHAMPYDKAEKIFRLALNKLNSGGKICIELRSLNDDVLKKNSVYNENDKSYKTTHKRWLYNKKMLEELSLTNKCNNIYIEEGYFSPNKNTETNNPLLIRFICQKI